jgi:hypothetical protein
MVVVFPQVFHNRIFQFPIIIIIYIYIELLL